MRFHMLFVFALAAAITLPSRATGQSLGNAGTIEGVVIDASGAVIPTAAVTLTNPVTGYSQSAVSGADG